MAQSPPVPEGYHNLQAYAFFADCGAAIEFYREAFGAREKMRVKSEQGRVMHAEIQLGDSVLMMAEPSEALQVYPPSHYGGSPVSFMLYVPDCDAVYRQALAQGAVSLRVPADQNYGDRMAGVQDPFGYTWWIATHIADVKIDS